MLPWVGPLWVYKAVAAFLQAQIFSNPRKMVSHIKLGHEENVTVFSFQMEPQQVRNQEMRSWGGVKEKEGFPLNILRKTGSGCRGSSGLV